MEKVVKRFDSLASADEAEDRYYASLTAQERLDLLLEIVARANESFGEAAERFERVCRATQLARS